MSTRYGPLVGFSLASLIGGMTLGVVVLGISSLWKGLGLPPLGLALTAGAAGLGALAWPPLGHMLPERSRQVRASCALGRSRMAAANRWGFQLGVGVSTYIVTPGFYGLVGGLLFVGSRAFVILAAGLYGVARAATIAGFAIFGSEHEAQYGTKSLLEGHLEPASRVPLAIGTAVVLVTAILRGA